MGLTQPGGPPDGGYDSPNVPAFPPFDPNAPYIPISVPADGGAGGTIITQDISINIDADALMEALGMGKGGKGGSGVRSCSSRSYGKTGTVGYVNKAGPMGHFQYMTELTFYGFRGAELSSNPDRCVAACYQVAECQGVEWYNGKCYRAWFERRDRLPRTRGSTQLRTRGCFGKTELRGQLIGMPRWWVYADRQHRWTKTRPTGVGQVKAENGLFCVLRQKVAGCNLVALTIRNGRLNLGGTGSVVGYVAETIGECGAFQAVNEWQLSLPKLTDFVYIPPPGQGQKTWRNNGRVFYVWINSGGGTTFYACLAQPLLAADHGPQEELHREIASRQNLTNRHAGGGQGFFLWIVWLLSACGAKMLGCVRRLWNGPSADANEKNLEEGKAQGSAAACSSTTFPPPSQDPGTRQMAGNEQRAQTMQEHFERFRRAATRDGHRQATELGPLTNVERVEYMDRCELELTEYYGGLRFSLQDSIRALDTSFEATKAQKVAHLAHPATMLQLTLRLDAVEAAVTADRGNMNWREAFP
ncbi:unnamed protein product, partial [Mesorhabditis spiculigera]